MDRVDSKTRSRIMQAIHSRDTKPELAVRRMIHALGFRYRLHVKSLPGTPDLVFPSKRKVVFVHGCFWHRHKRCSYATSPTTNIEFWDEKFRNNVLRDRRTIRALKKQGWSAMIVWQCQLKNPSKLGGRLNEFLED